MALCMRALLEVFKHYQCADYAVFVKAVAPIRAAKVSAIDAVDFGLSFLSVDTRRGVERMIVAQTFDDLRGIDGVGHVQADQQGRGSPQSLQDVHVVGDRHAALLAL